ncbi:hypothetical protein Bbelb_264150 [Branchiostoma belcheri]|nr:hypothetical protein Bbelb_264150 [Branchiostoma belcheri]
MTVTRLVSLSPNVDTKLMSLSLNNTQTRLISLSLVLNEKRTRPMSLSLVLNDTLTRLVPLNDTPALVSPYRYISYCRFQEEKARLRRQAAAATGELRKDVSAFLAGMEERLQTSRGRWLIKKAELEGERQALFNQMVGLYQDVAWAVWLTGGQRTGAYTPLLPIRMLRSSTPGGTRRRREEGVFLQPMGDDDVLIGRNMVIASLEDDQYWKTSSVGAPGMAAMVTTPAMLSMDINQSRDGAKKTFRHHFLTKAKEDGDTPSGLSIAEGRLSRFRATGPSSQHSQLKRHAVLPPVATLYPSSSPDMPEWMEYPLPFHQQSKV